VTTAQRVARPIGELLVERGLIDEAELEDALAEQERTKRPIGEILVARGLVSRPALSLALADQLGVELEIEQGFGAGLWAQIARRHERGVGADHEDDVPGGGHHAVEVPGPGTEEPVAVRDTAAPASFDQYLLVTQELSHRLAETEIQLKEARAELATRARATSGRPSSATQTHLLVVEFEEGYAVLAREGAPPRKATKVDVPELGGAFVVKKVGRSPFPLDGRRCAYLERRG